MGHRNERGEVRLTNFITLALLVAMAWAGWNLWGAYWPYWDFKDKINEIARTPRYKAPTDDRIMDLLMKEVRQRGLDYYIKPNNFQISTTETGRRIRLYYEREVQVLPGFKKVLKFDFQADQPLV